MSDNPERSTGECTYATYLSDAVRDLHGNPVLDPLPASAGRFDEADVGVALATLHHQAHLQQRPSQYLVSVSPLLAGPGGEERYWTQTRESRGSNPNSYRITSYCPPPPPTPFPH